MEVKETKEIKANEVQVVKEYLDVFLEDLPRLLLNKEIKFIIDLVLKIEPISIPPYQMAPVEPKKLKVQLQELLDKGFI